MGSNCGALNSVGYEMYIYILTVCMMNPEQIPFLSTFYSKKTKAWQSQILCAVLQQNRLQTHKAQLQREPFGQRTTKTKPKRRTQTNKKCSSLIMASQIF